MIPKILHLCWLSGDAFPEKIQKCLDSWKEILPDYEIKLWDSKTFDVNICNWTKQAFEKKQYAFVADYVRFYALYNYGGIYLDSDVEVVKSFNDLLENKFFFGYEYTALPEAAVVGAEKGLNWCKICLSYYETHDFLDKNGNMQRIIAPLIMKNGFESSYKLKLIDDESEKEVDCGKIYTYDYFSAKNGFSGEVVISENTYSIHHFNSAWLKAGFKLKFKKCIHRFLIKLLGKKNYNNLLYKVRDGNKNIIR